MCELKEVQEILNPFSIKISVVSLSYVNRLFPEFNGSPCIILHKVPPSLRHTEVDSDFECDNGQQTSEFDITGSPLKYSFDEEEFEDSFTLIQRNWRKEEEKYLPLDRNRACSSLNACIERLSHKSPPLFALCNGEDSRKTHLLGTVIREEYLTSIEVCSLGIETFTESQKSCNILQEHQKLRSIQHHNVTISAFNVFNLFGIKEETIHWNGCAKNLFEGSISIEVETNSLTSFKPKKTSKNNMVIQVATGADNSPLLPLWKEILLLNEYLTIIENYKKNETAQCNSLPLKFPQNLKIPFAEDHAKIMKNLSSLLNENYSYRNTKDADSGEIDFENTGSIDIDMRIEQYLQNLPFRHNLDLTDYLWELLIKNTNHLEMTRCIHKVLEEIASGGYLSQISFTNVTRFAQIISDLDPQKTISHLLSGSLPLEYVIDMGFQKLSRDYMYILLNTRFAELHDIRQNFEKLSSGQFNVDVYRKKLICMAQIHICLEFMVLIQNNVSCTVESLRTLLTCAFNQFVCKESPIQSHESLHENVICNLKAPLPASLIDSMSKEIPITRRISLSSETKFSQLTTTKYYSRLPIFPTSIYSPEDKKFLHAYTIILDDIDTMDETYHVTTCVCSSTKFK